MENLTLQKEKSGWMAVEIKTKQNKKQMKQNIYFMLQIKSNEIL